MQSHGNDNPHTLRGPYSFPVLPEVTLEIVRGQAKHKCRPIEVPVFLIGQAGDCDLVIGDPQFPEVHTYIFVTTQSVTVRCLGEGPEILVNSIPVKSTELHNGDLLQMGSYEFQISIKQRSHKERVQNRGDQDANNEASAIARELIRDVRHELLSGPSKSVRNKHQSKSTESIS